MLLQPEIKIKPKELNQSQILFEKLVIFFNSK